MISVLKVVFRQIFFSRSSPCLQLQLRYFIILDYMQSNKLDYMQSNKKFINSNRD